MVSAKVIGECSLAALNIAIIVWLVCGSAAVATRFGVRNYLDTQQSFYRKAVRLHH